MTRLVLSFSVSVLVLVVGVLAAWRQSENYAEAAQLDQLQRQCAWWERSKSALREQIERFEFEWRVEQNRITDDRFTRGDR